ncbi:MAG: S41 family peptidase [Bacillota bacterium]
MEFDRYGSHRRGHKFFTGLAIALFVLIVGVGWLLASNYKQFGNLVKVIVLVKTQYLNTVDYDTLVEGAIKGIVKSLDDPYSAYLDPATYQQLREQIKGSFGGLGILVGMKDEYLTVVNTYKGTPAYRAGIQPGDVISRIDNREVRGIDLETAVHLMRGPVGTKVTLTLMRSSVPKPFDVELPREEITLPSVESHILKNGIAYIGLAQFTEKTPEEMEENIAKLKKQGMRAVILDLRNNPGGELMSAVKVSRHFLPPGPVVYIDYRGGRQEEHSTEGNDIKLPMAVLINNSSASAAEILAGAIKDTGSGVLVGQKTFGKGVVQMVFDLDNGAGLKLTTARYLTPKKNDINKKGIMPDVVVNQPPGGPDVQLQRAIEILSEKLANKAA